MQLPSSCPGPKQAHPGAPGRSWQDAVCPCCTISCTHREHGGTHGKDAGRVSVQRRQQVIGSVAGRLQRARRPACSRLQMPTGTPNACHAASHRRGEPGDPAESGHTRGSEVARYSRAPPLPPPCHSPSRLGSPLAAALLAPCAGISPRLLIHRDLAPRRAIGG